MKLLWSRGVVCLRFDEVRGIFFTLEEVVLFLPNMSLAVIGDFSSAKLCSSAFTLAPAQVQVSVVKLPYQLVSTLHFLLSGS